MGRTVKNVVSTYNLAFWTVFKRGHNGQGKGVGILPQIMCDRAEPKGKIEGTQLRDAENIA